MRARGISTRAPEVKTSLNEDGGGVNTDIEQPFNEVG
jgi:hypothetical protein